MYLLHVLKGCGILPQVASYFASNRRIHQLPHSSNVLNNSTVLFCKQKWHLSLYSFGIAVESWNQYVLERNDVFGVGSNILHKRQQKWRNTLRTSFTCIIWSSLSLNIFSSPQNSEQQQDSRTPKWILLWIVYIGEIVSIKTINVLFSSLWCLGFWHCRLRI